VIAEDCSVVTLFQPFIDAFVVGDGEEVVGETREVRRRKAEGRSRVIY
jgi:hypothetical protein